ncbi:putative quinol monooxygenase [Methyloligella solikamskensis]|uniref:Quinol monooxygenase n=1 Tax=Methyloligella solikamskensis TaxID=1177756 RepID=A0ABW3J8S3_9HYPH
MSKIAGVIPFKAKPGQGADVAQALADALPHVEKETGTPLWMVLHSEVDPDCVFLVDLFTDEAAREAHMKGDAAAQIFATVPDLLAEEPVIHPAKTIAHKGI